MQKGIFGQMESARAYYNGVLVFSMTNFELLKKNTLDSNSDIDSRKSVGKNAKKNAIGHKLAVVSV